TIGNQVKLLINGETKFREFLQSLREAVHSIHLEYYIFEMGTIGSEVMQIIEEKAKSGVLVRLVADSIGSPALVRSLSKRQDCCFVFDRCSSVSVSALGDSNYRCRHKIAVIDVEIGYIGGINISDSCLNPPENKTPVVWRDTALRI